eukprot:CAMPEP_0196576280 /NCGR_PEP_ID=MMETSP1081-20130531/5584_1 /TAXON_ID=36882 /ORGANISM="Pyramimonas amylifera, Strain CCMP720" /LENGTH=214 /DNA_ID=CAMNT_0041894849 /DNA_START=261 /DNA_END=905 /DNA_ORIENTATION=+
MRLVEEDFDWTEQVESDSFDGLGSVDFANHGVVDERPVVAKSDGVSDVKKSVVLRVFLLLLLHVDSDFDYCSDAVELKVMVDLQAWVAATKSWSKSFLRACTFAHRALAFVDASDVEAKVDALADSSTVVLAVALGDAVTDTMAVALDDVVDVALGNALGYAVVDATAAALDDVVVDALAAEEADEATVALTDALTDALIAALTDALANALTDV